MRTTRGRKATTTNRVGGSSQGTLTGRAKVASLKNGAAVDGARLQRASERPVFAPKREFDTCANFARGGNLFKTILKPRKQQAQKWRPKITARHCSTRALDKPMNQNSPSDWLDPLRNCSPAVNNPLPSGVPDGNQTKRTKADGANGDENTEGASSKAPQLRPPFPHHDLVTVLSKMRGSKRWQKARKYCVIMAGVMNLYARSADPYKKKSPQHMIDLSAATIVVYPKELKVAVTNKETTHFLKAKDRIHFDRLLENVHNHRCYGLALLEFKQSLNKSMLHLGNALATVELKKGLFIPRKDLASAQELWEELGRIIKDMEWIINTTATVTTPLICMHNVQDQNQQRNVRESLRKRLIRLSKVPIRQRINAIRKRIRKKSSSPVSLKVAMRENGADNYTSDPLTSSLKEYLVTQENFLQIAKMCKYANDLVAKEKPETIFEKILVHEKAQNYLIFLKKQTKDEVKLETIEMNMFGKDANPDLNNKTRGGSKQNESIINQNQTVTLLSASFEDDSISDSSDGNSVKKEVVIKLQQNAQLVKKESGEKKNCREGWDLYHMKGVYQAKRKILPASMSNIKISLWSILKQCFGQNLTRISLPVIIFEPLNMLQVVCEELEYSWLLDKAASEDDRSMRMAYVALFAISRYKSTQYRTGRKPFNPILGETYECIRQDLGWRYVAEQVSHHPPISACHAESDHWIFWQSMTATVRFWGNSVEAQPVSTVHIIIKKRKEEYTYNKATTYLQKILYESRYYEHQGVMKFHCKNEQTDPIRCSVSMLKDHFVKNKLGQTVLVKGEVAGQIYDEYGKLSLSITGNWTKGFEVNGTKIWKPHVPLQNFQKYYGFTTFSITLNEMPDEEGVSYLPPTDTRFRPDQRLIELGRMEEAEQKKQHLEQTQREKRKQLAMAGLKHTTKWFNQTSEENGFMVFSYNGEYWPARMKKFEGYTFEPLWD